MPGTVPIFVSAKMGPSPLSQEASRLTRKFRWPGCGERSHLGGSIGIWAFRGNSDVAERRESVRWKTSVPGRPRLDMNAVASISATMIFANTFTRSGHTTRKTLPLAESHNTKGWFRAIHSIKNLRALKSAGCLNIAVLGVFITPPQKHGCYRRSWAIVGLPSSGS